MVIDNNLCEPVVSSQGEYAVIYSVLAPCHVMCSLHLTMFALRVVGPSLQRAREKEPFPNLSIALRYYIEIPTSFQLPKCTSPNALELQKKKKKKEKRKGNV